MTAVGCNIPLDLTIEILVRLPAQSVLRFKSVSKSWLSIISSKQFIEAFMIRSPPRLLFAFNNCDDYQLHFFSSPHQSCSFSSSSSMIVAKKNTLTMTRDTHYGRRIIFINSVRGFVCCLFRNQFMVCNPTTGQVINLAENHDDYDYGVHMYLGYDPNSDQYKVLRIQFSFDHYSPIEHSVCTLGSKESCPSWRPIKTSFLYYSCGISGVSIDGIMYYIYYISGGSLVGYFDVGSEQLHIIETPAGLSGDLTNYPGKLAVHDGNILWVLDDVKNQVWSKKTVISSYMDLFGKLRKAVGITVSGEIVYRPVVFDDPFEISCYDVEKKIERWISVEGLSSFTLNSNRIYFDLLCSYVDSIIYL